MGATSSLIGRYCVRYTYRMKVEITTEHTKPTFIEQEAEEEIRAFEKWFMTLGNTGGLTRPEIAILKTYLGWRMDLFNKTGG